jgi:hypothetical protein
MRKAFILTVLILAALIPTVSGTLTDGLVSWHDFADGNWEAEGAVLSNLTLSGSVTYSASGYGNGVAQCSGGLLYFNDANAEYLTTDYANGITMCGYVNLTSTSFYETFWAFRGAATEYMTLKAYVSTPLNAFTEIRPASGDTVWNTAQSNFYVYNKFIHVCQRYDTDYRYTLWRNGTVIVNVTEANWDSKFEFGTSPGWKGGICAEESGGSPDNPMEDGQIAFFGIWNRSLTTSEIQELYNDNVPLEYDDLGPVNDTTAPTITSNTNTTTDTTADLTIGTDEAANITVNYGINSSLTGGTESSASLLTTHLINITGLTASTTYQYNVTLCDAEPNCATYGPFNFTTIATPIPNPPIIFNQSIITPSIAYTADTLVGSCNSTIYQAGTYYYNWYRNGTFYSTGQNTTAIINDTLQQVAYINSTDIYKGDTWIFECSNSTVVGQVTEVIDNFDEANGAITTSSQNDMGYNYGDNGCSYQNNVLYCSGASNYALYDFPSETFQMDMDIKWDNSGGNKWFCLGEASCQVYIDFTISGDMGYQAGGFSPVLGNYAVNNWYHLTLTISNSTETLNITFDGDEYNNSGMGYNWTGIGEALRGGYGFEDNAGESLYIDNLTITYGSGETKATSGLNSTPLTISNTAPTSPVAVVLLPTTIYNGTDVVCNITNGTDADADSLQNYIRWYFDDVEDTNYENQTTVTGRSESISMMCSVAHFDGEDTSGFTNSTPVTVSSSWILQGSNLSLEGDQLVGKCNSTFLNASAPTYYYNWYRNGTFNATGTNATVAVNNTMQQVAYLDTAGLTTGDLWKFECSLSQSAGAVTTSIDDFDESDGVQTAASQNDQGYNYSSTGTFCSYSSTHLLCFGASSSATFDSEYPISNVSFDFKYSGSDPNFIKFGAMAVDFSGTPAMTIEPDLGSIPINTGQWYNVNLILDHANKKANLSLDGVFKGTANHNLASNETYTIASSGAGGDLRIDNLTITSGTGSATADTGINSTEVAAPAGNVAPVMNTTTITPATAYNNTDLTGTCYATDSDGAVSKYYYEWFKNDVSISTGAYTVPNSSLTDGLYFHYSMTEGSGTSLADSTSNSFDATIVGMEWTSSAAIGDYSINATNGGDYFYTDSDIDQAQFGSWAAEMWIQPTVEISDATGTPAYFERIINNEGAGTGNRIELYMGGVGATGERALGVIVDNGGYNTYNNASFNGSTTSWYTDKWYRLLITYDKPTSNLVVWVNDTIEIDTHCADCGWDDLNADYQVYFNTYGGLIADTRFGGEYRFDQISMWNRSINNTEAAELYNEGASKLYPFNIGEMEVSTLTASSFVKDDAIILGCTAYDGEDNSSWLNSSTLTISNSAPTVPTGVTVSPTTVYPGDTIYCNFTNSTDIDLEALTYNTTWYNNSVEATPTVLTGGDVWSCGVKAYDGTDYSAVTNSTNSITIAYLPEMSTSRIAPTTAYNNTDLVGYCNGTDSDGDGLTYYYEWFKNDVSIDSGLYEPTYSELNIGYGSTSNGYTGTPKVIQLSRPQDVLYTGFKSGGTTLVRGIRCYTDTATCSGQVSIGISYARQQYDIIKGTNYIYTFHIQGSTHYIDTWNHNMTTKSNSVTIHTGLGNPLDQVSLTQLSSGEVVGFYRYSNFYNNITICSEDGSSCSNYPGFTSTVDSQVRVGKIIERQDGKFLVGMYNTTASRNIFAVCDSLTDLSTCNVSNHPTFNWYQSNGAETIPFVEQEDGNMIFLYGKQIYECDEDMANCVSKGSTTSDGNDGNVVLVPGDKVATFTETGFKSEITLCEIDDIPSSCVTKQIGDGVGGDGNESDVTAIGILSDDGKLVTARTQNTVGDPVDVLYTNTVASYSGIDTQVSTLSADSFVKEDNIILQCLAQDGARNSSKLNSSTVTILDTPPTVPTLCNLTEGGKTDTFEATASGSTDIDLDSIYYQFQFEIGNESTTLQSWSNSSNYTGCAGDPNCNKDDDIMVRCRAVADGVNSLILNSSISDIGNTAPVITVIEPNGVSDENRDEDFTVTWSATDADSDTLNISCYADDNATGQNINYTGFINTSNDGTQNINVTNWDQSTYYMWCVADDGSTISVDYSSGELQVNHEPGNYISDDNGAGVVNDDTNVTYDGTWSDPNDYVHFFVSYTANDSECRQNNGTTNTSNCICFELNQTDGNGECQQDGLELLSGTQTWYSWACDDQGRCSNQSMDTWEPNTRPTLTAPTLNTPLYIDSTATCTVGTYTDNESDSEIVSNREYQWYLNESIVAGQTGATLSISAISAQINNTIICAWRTSDEHSYYGNWTNSSAETIVNRPPSIETVLVLPSSYGSGEDLMGYCTPDDADDQDLTIHFAWYKEGNATPELSGSYTGITAPYQVYQVSNLSSNLTLTNEDWMFTCLANDGFVNGTIKSLNFTIGDDTTQQPSPNPYGAVGTASEEDNEREAIPDVVKEILGIERTDDKKTNQIVIILGVIALALFLTGGPAGAGGVKRGKR